MGFLPAIAMVTLILKVIDFARYARAGDKNGVFTQLSVWLAGVLVVLLVSQTNWAAHLVVGGLPLSKLGIFSLIFYGLSAGSAASLTKDTLKAVDNTNSAAIPTLIPTGERRAPSAPRDVG